MASLLENIPKDFIDPVTLDIMSNPFTLVPCGHSLDKVTLDNLKQHNNYLCPICRKEYTQSVPNHQLRNTIEDFLKNKEKELDKKVSDQTKEKKIKECYVENVDGFLKIASDHQSERCNKNIIMVLDTSYSMDDVVKDSNKEVHGFTRLDLVKFVTTTIIHLLKKGDSISIITFSDRATILVDLKKGLINDNKKNIIIDRVNSISVNGCTYMWDGIELAFDSLNKTNIDKNETSIILLTDGAPSEGRPVRGILPTLDKYLSLQGIFCPIHTFLFGYDGKPNLMYKIAQKTGGTFGFISDASMMSTFIINKVTSILNTYCNKIEIEFKYSCEDEKLKEIFCDYPFRVDKDNKTCLVNIGGLQSDLPRCFDFSDKLDILQLINLYCDENQQKINKISETESVIKGINTKICNNVRLEFIDALSFLKDNILNNEKSEINKMLTKILEICEKCLTENITEEENVYIYNFICEIQNEITIGFSDVQETKKWLLPYLLSLKSSHLHIFCSDFKNYSIKEYKGPIFEKIKDEISDIFDKLPAPKPSKKSNQNYRSLSLNGIANIVTNQRPISMTQSFNSVYGGCFSGMCKIDTIDGNKYVKDLKPNDVVKTDKGVSKVKYIVITDMNKNISMCKLNQNAYITNWHPVRINNEWIFPNNCLKNLNIFVDKIYNLILQNDHIIYLNGIEVVTLGHGFEGEVIQHDFFGNMKEINKHYISKSKDGYIKLNQNDILRSSNGLVIGLK